MLAAALAALLVSTRLFAADPPAPTPGIAKWAPFGNGVALTLSDGRIVQLTARSPLAVRLSWGAERAGKSADWAIVPSPADMSDVKVEEAGGQVVLSTSQLRVTTPVTKLDLQVFYTGQGDTRHVMALPLQPGAVAARLRCAPRDRVRRRS